MSPKNPILEIGSEKMTGPIIIVGIVRDISKTIKDDLERLSKAFESFQPVNWFLVESGSSDDSKEALLSISKGNSNFKFISITNRPDFSRTENMALARNVYLEHLQRDKNYDNYKYVVVADFNNLNNRITASSIFTCFTNIDWDVVTANQSGRYYDIWALRHPLWSPNDCWEQHAFLRKFIKFPEFAVSYAIRSRMIKIPRDSDWIEVDSAFGGLAIYKSHVFSTPAQYAGVSLTGSRVCEHVIFHEALRKTGVHIYINPALINANYTDHSLRVTWPYTSLRILAYPLKYLFSRNGRI